MSSAQTLRSTGRVYRFVADYIRRCGIALVHGSAGRVKTKAGVACPVVFVGIYRDSGNHSEIRHQPGDPFVWLQLWNAAGELIAETNEHRTLPDAQIAADDYWRAREAVTR